MTEQDVLTVIESGELTAKKIGASYRIKRSALDEYLAEMKHRDRADRSVLAFFLCFFFLFSSGRIASQDRRPAAAGVGTACQCPAGSATTAAVPARPTRAGCAHRTARLYQAHDIGNIVLMLPAALDRRPALGSARR